MTTDLAQKLAAAEVMIAELQKQRDELLAAAKFFMRSEGDYDLIKAGKLFQAAIASVKAVMPLST